MQARRRRWPWILLGVLVALPLLAFVAARLLVDPEALRPRLVAAVEQATGRAFTLSRLDLAVSLRPTVELHEVALANAEGGSRPQMLTARRVEVQAALLPLLSGRLEVARVVLDRPDLLLETDAQGRPNWVFRPDPAAQPGPAAPSGEPPAPGSRLSVDALRIVEGRLAWRDARAGTAEVLEIERLDAAAPRAGPTTAAATLRLRGQPVQLRVEAGALAAFGGAAPWPVRAELAALGATARLDGTLAAGGAWTAALEATLPALGALAPLLPDQPLPPLRDVAASARLAGTGAALANAEALRLRIGRSDLSALRPDLVLEEAELRAAGLGAPLMLAARGQAGPLPLQASGSLGTPAQLLGQAPGPMQVQLRLGAIGASANLTGTLRDPRALAGVDLALAGQVPELAQLSPLAGQRLPELRDIAFTARLSERSPGFAGGALLRDIRLALPEAEAAGDLTLVIGERPGLAGRIAMPRLDLDALRAALPAAQPAAPPPGAAPPAAVPATPPRPAAPGRAAARVIPDIPFPMALLRSLDADLRLGIERLVAGGEEWHDIEARLAIDAGKARLAPLTATTPAGPLRIEAEADATAEPPALSLRLRADALDLAAAARLAGAAPVLTGMAQLDLDAAGQGAGLRAWTAGLGGHLGLAVVDGALARSVLAGLPAELVNTLLPALRDGQDIALRCLALRAPMASGTARVQTLLAEGPLGRVGGTGGINLAEETLALRLETDLRGRIALRAPVGIGGTLAAPRVAVDPAAAAAAGLGALLSTQGTPDRTLGAIAGALGGGGARAPAFPDCAEALAAARGGRAGPMPTSAGAPAAAPEPAPAAPGAAQPAPALPRNPAELLRGLLGR